METGGDRDKKGTTDNSTQLSDNQLRADNLQAERDLWEAYRAMYARKGVVLEDLLDECTRKFIEPLEPVGAREDFQQLSKSGCHPWVLAAILALIRHKRAIETFWNLAVGPPETRESICATLIDAADCIERMFGDAANNIAQLGRPSPTSIASELRFYGRVLNLAPLLAQEMEVRSLEHISTLILARYVEKATGGPQHAEVAGLISELRPDADYTGDAQRQWRHRNKDLFENSSSALAKVTDFLVAMGRVLPRSM